MGMKYYDPAVWHRDTWKFRRAEREFQIEIAQHALTEELEDEARFRQFSRMVSLAAEAAQAPRDEPSQEGFEDEDELVAYDEFDEQESNAAVKIQAGARGMIARNRVKALRDVKQKREASGRTEGGEPAKEEAEEVFFEGSDEEQAAAVKIQAVQRGKVARKQMAEKRAAAVAAEAEPDEEDD
eukprot:CAMPEP_0198210222 /NCGR_PEP_ID=MMETSP1445-20131203/19969_1 /TAXON_ID=36898 /ORGANISM="Pyramimonas sp., Strain CCMP2087" /LENGTH=182 /DNA_ID=CAMNT_0043884229 /DNA_START=180 /DNA_END=728 /DNA_ORIENTATION=-